MRDTIRMIPMRGFTAAVAREEIPEPQLQAAGVAVGIDGDGDDCRIAILTRHADGTMLTLYLTVNGVDRLAHMLADLVGDAMAAPIGAGAMLQ